MIGASKMGIFIIAVMPVMVECGHCWNLSSQRVNIMGDKKTKFADRQEAMINAKDWFFDNYADNKVKLIVFSMHFDDKTVNFRVVVMGNDLAGYKKDFVELQEAQNTFKSMNNAYGGKKIHDEHGNIKNGITCEDLKSMGFAQTGYVRIGENYEKTENS